MQTFDFISIIYLFFALGLGLQLWKNRGLTFDLTFTDTDRRLTSAFAFYYCIPIVTVLHELGHAIATWILGGYIKDFHFMFYWAYVIPARVPPFLPWENALTAFAGNLISIVIGLILIAWVQLKPMRASLNYLRLEVARFTLLITLIVYPAFSLLLQMGDFHIIREELNKVYPFAGDVSIALYCILSFFVYRKWKSHWRFDFQKQVSPTTDLLFKAQKDFEHSPNDPKTLLRLGQALFANGSNRKALQYIQQSISADPQMPEAYFTLGLIQFKEKQLLEASKHLRHAGLLIEQTPHSHSNNSNTKLLAETTLALATVRLSLHDFDGAILTADRALQLLPQDSRALLLKADIFSQQGKKEEAREILESLLKSAQGAARVEIQKKIRSLS